MFRHDLKLFRHQTRYVRRCRKACAATVAVGRGMWEKALHTKSGGVSDGESALLPTIAALQPAIFDSRRQERLLQQDGLMRRTISYIATLCACMTAASSLPAQQVSLALRGASMATSERVAGAKLDPGFGLGSTLGVRVMPHLEMYGGWDWLHFRADQSLRGSIATSTKPVIPSAWPSIIPSQRTVARITALRVEVPTSTSKSKTTTAP